MKEEYQAYKDALKPCPFCGGAPMFYFGKGKEYKGIFIECEDCGARLPIIEGKGFNNWRKNSYYESFEEKAFAMYGHTIVRTWNERIQVD